ncbi:unnamed protein product [Protopolystoma xenopodis]|uniref:Uncharacterized protein n=1 Tax=Protopolystoma xenopodis TaxID=117903 RepID=A0A3S5FBW4_9PLAT|nr:unnamed protein product [Protopolystoma xenopodis]
MTDDNGSAELQSLSPVHDEKPSPPLSTNSFHDAVSLDNQQPSSHLHTNFVNGNQAHFHHRRKRVRVSPVRMQMDHDTASDGSGSSGFSASAPSFDITSKDIDQSRYRLSEIQEGDAELDHKSPQLSPFHHSCFPLDGQEEGIGNCPKMDPEVRAIISKFVHSDTVIHCLELAGFTTAPVLACLLDISQIRQLEDYVRNACELMPSRAARVWFLGSLFAHRPDRFRLPAGAICGLRLAINELSRRDMISSHSDSKISYGHAGSVSPHRSSSDEDKYGNANDGDCHDDPSLHNEMIKFEAGCQTSLSLPLILDTTNHLAAAAAAFLPITCASASTCIADTNSTTSFNTGNSHSSIVSDSGSMASTITVSSAHVSHTQGCNSAAMVSINNTVPGSASISNNLQSPVCSGANSSIPLLPFLSNNQQSSSHLLSTNTIPNSVVVGATGTTGSGMLDEERIDLERLKQHATASAVRLATRQFINAHLIRGRDFDMEMELSITAEGLKRVTGIFYCHLCREKRDRTSAVRFSIARNRHPVMSNVLSHLKMHFQYRGQTLPPSNGAHVIHQTSTPPGVYGQPKPEIFQMPSHTWQPNAIAQSPVKPENVSSPQASSNPNSSAGATENVLFSPNNPAQQQPHTFGGSGMV